MNCPNCNSPEEMSTGAYTGRGVQTHSVALHTCTECGYSELR